MNNPIKIITVVGARPQFIKAAAVSRAISSNFAGQIEEKIVHTGQHFDDSMSKVFFDELEIPQPQYHLSVSGGSHGAMTGRMLEAVEEVLIKEKPEWLLVYGDTNSTLAGALAAAKLHIPVAHVEAGLRSFNMRMPEEINRIIADRLSSRLFCPTLTAVENLTHEGITEGVSLVGDVMYDVALHFKDVARDASDAIQRFGLVEGSYVLATCHRAENTDDPIRLEAILRALGDIANEMPVLLPLHPRTRKIISQRGLTHALGKVKLVEPLCFMDMVRLELSARVILTDSGGVQKEAFFYRVPCVTMRDETEWVETIQLGWNKLVGANQRLIVDAVLRAVQPGDVRTQPYGNGAASNAIIEKLLT
jgi:UDP-GlcNAc3NAcA epimerase